MTETNKANNRMAKDGAPFAQHPLTRRSFLRTLGVAAAATASAVAGAGVLAGCRSERGDELVKGINGQYSSAQETADAIAAAFMPEEMAEEEQTQDFSMTMSM